MRTNFKGFFFFFGFSLQENVRRVSREGRESIEVCCSFNYRKGSYRISLSDISGRFLCQEVAEKDKEDNLRTFYRQYRFI